MLQNPCLLVLLLVGILVCGQLWLLNYTAGRQVPAASNLEAGERLVSRLREAEGPVFVPAAPYLLALAGKPVHFHASALGDLQLAGERDTQVQVVVSQLQPALADALERVRTAVLPNARWFDDLFSPQNGYACQELALSGEDLETVSGAVSSSRLLCTRK